MTALDREVLGQLAADLSAADLSLVLETFESDMQRLGAALKAAGQAGDVAAWRRSAHGMAGAAAAVGASGVERLARAASVEAAIDPVSVDRVLVAVSAAITMALDELHDFAAPGSSGG